MQSSLEETFTRFWGHLVTMLGGHRRQSKSSVTSSAMDAKVDQISSIENKLAKNSGQEQNKINKQGAQISSLQDQNTQLKGCLYPELLVDAISHAVNTGLKITSKLTSKGGAASNGTGFVSKPYLGKPRPSQLAPRADGSLNLDLECWYCKDTGHLKDNCIKLNCQLTMEQKNSDPNTAPETCTPKSNLAN